MSLSYTSGPSGDLAALLGSDIDFKARLDQLKEATEKHDRALANLNLGATAQNAYEVANKIKLDMERSQTAHNERLEIEARRQQAWLEERIALVHAENDRMIAATREELNQATEKHAQAARALEDARDIVAKAKADAAQILADARNRIAKSEEMMKLLGA